jgi:VIT1/CCC1 family predicted Fe2+/Mn2+ transporter
MQLKKAIVMKILSKILGVFLIGLAIYLLDSSSWNGIILSTILLFSGLAVLFQDSKSEFGNRFSKFLNKVAFVLAVIFLIIRFINH